MRKSVSWEGWAVGWWCCWALQDCRHPHTVLTPVGFAIGRSHLSRTWPSPSPRCASRWLRQLVKITGSPLKSISSAQSAKAFLWSPGGFRRIQRLQLVQLPRHPRGCGIPLSPAHELCSSNPFSGACPAAGNVGQAGF